MRRNDHVDMADALLVPTRAAQKDLRPRESPSGGTGEAEGGASTVLAADALEDARAMRARLVREALVGLLVSAVPWSRGRNRTGRRIRYTRDSRVRPRLRRRNSPVGRSSGFGRGRVAFPLRLVYTRCKHRG